LIDGAKCISKCLLERLISIVDQAHVHTLGR
jgi:hypothetical protein